ncbi:MAG: ATP-binding cassette domain-containing protein [Lachnospiraceae bacterium]|nr:ATP-binding cassette domain-containing protein [Lachnospiraceae bacterium]
MGWFEDQLKQRKENDDIAFGDSFLSLAGINVDDDEYKKIKEESYKTSKLDHEGKATIRDYIRFVKDAIPIGTIIVAGILSLVATGVGMLLPYFTQILTGEVVQVKDFNLFVSVSIYVVAAAIGGLLISTIQGFVGSRINIKMDQLVTRKTMARLLNLPASFFKKYNTGELSQRFASTINLASILMNGVVMSLVSAIMSMAYLVQLTQFAPALILPTVIVLIATTGFSILISFIQARVSKVQMVLSSKKSGLTYETINGIQKIRLSGSEKRVFVKWAEVYARAARLLYNPPLIIRLSAAITALISLIGDIVIYFVAVQSGVDVGDYMAFQTSYGVLAAAFASLTQVVSSMASVPPILNMASPILEETPEEEEEKMVLDKVNGNIKLDNVSFSYGENMPNVLDGINLDIHSGDYIAIVGKTGCGKSTLVRLLLGFEKPKNGNIYYDEHNMNDIDLTSLRRNIGTVTQNGTLFHADIFSNIIISAPNLKVDDAWVAAEIANIADDIRDMPMGMKTVISEGQGSISGGQKQRIMIARAIVHKPKILIFDEATSALDNVTQKSIAESIGKLECTRIVIAHRLSTIQNADRIIMLEGGHIIEDGTYDELIKYDGKFAELVERQRIDLD